MRVKSDCDRVPVERNRGRTAAGANWLDAARTLTTGLRVSPSLAATGFQEMRPAFALDLASIGRCVYGHQAGCLSQRKSKFSVLRSARNGKNILCGLHRSRI